MAFVNECPKNETEFITSSKRLKCGTDKYGNNQYICVPNKEKSSLVELCYDGIIGPQENGNCIEESKGKLIPYNCSRFRYGCPDDIFDSNAVYKYPACQEINTHYGCYVMEPSCQPREAKKENDVAVLYSCLGVFVAVIIVVAILLYLKWKSKSKCRKGNSKSGYTKTGTQGDKVDLQDKKPCPGDNPVLPYTFKIWSCNRNEKFGICLSSLEITELKEKCIKKFCIQKDESRYITFVLEKDGTEVDEEYLKHIETDTIVMLLKQDENWSKAEHFVASTPTGKQNLAKSTPCSTKYYGDSDSDEEQSSPGFEVCSFDRNKEKTIKLSYPTCTNLKRKCISQFEISEEDEDHLRFVLEADGTEVDDDYLKTVNAKLMILNRNEKWKQKAITQTVRINTLSQPVYTSISRATIPFKVWSSDRKIRKGIVVSYPKVDDLKEKCKKAFKIEKKDLDRVKLVLEKDGTEVKEELLKTLGENTYLIILKPGERWSPAPVFFNQPKKQRTEGIIPFDLRKPYY